MALQTKSIAANGSRGHHKFTLTVTENSTSIENNTSSVSWKFVLSPIQTSWDWNHSSTVPVTYSVAINGKTYSGNIMKYDGSSTVTVASGTESVTHNTDGNKTISYNFSVSSANYTYLPGSANASGSMVLTFIARASVPSCITWPEHTENVGYFGDRIAIFMNSKSSAFRHTVYYTYGPTSALIKETIATGVVNDTYWDIPPKLMDLLPATTEGAGRIYVDTYNGSTLVGTKYCVFRAKVPESVKPTVGMTLEDITGIDDIYGKPVQRLSKIKITVNATPAYSSPIASYKITANGATYLTKEATTDVLTMGGNSVVTVTATDKRGRSNSASYTMSVISYSPPQCLSLSVIRCNMDGTANKRGEFIKISFIASGSSFNGKNPISYSIQYKRTTEENYTDLFADLNGIRPSDFVGNSINQSFIIPVSVSSSYDVLASAADRHNANNPATISAKAPTAHAIFSWRGFKNASGEKEDGAGIGRVPEKPNVLQVGWDAEFEKTVKRMGNRYCFSTPGIAGTAGFIKMATLTHKNVNADTPITFVFTRRLEPSPMTVHIQFESNSANPDPDLKTISYEGSNYGAFLVRSKISVWDLYVQKVSAYDTITLQDWFSTATVDDRLTVSFPGELVDSVPQGLDGFYRATPAKLDNLLDYIFPVGYVVTLFNHTNPADLWGGTWERLTGGFLWASNSGDTIGQTGGEKTHTLTLNEIPSHTHGSVYSGNVTGSKTHAWLASGGSNMAYGTVYAGGGAAHNNMPPYIQVSIWRRTA